MPLISYNKLHSKQRVQPTQLFHPVCNLSTEEYNDCMNEKMDTWIEDLRVMIKDVYMNELKRSSTSAEESYWINYCLRNWKKSIESLKVELGAFFRESTEYKKKYQRRRKRRVLYFFFFFCCCCCCI